MKKAIGIILATFIAGASLVGYGFSNEPVTIVKMDLIECYTGVSGTRTSVYETYKCDLNNDGYINTEYYSRQGWKTMASYPVGTTFDIPVKNPRFDLSVVFGAFLMFAATLFSLPVVATYQEDKRRKLR